MSMFLLLAWPVLAASLIVYPTKAALDDAASRHMSATQVLAVALVVLAAPCYLGPVVQFIEVFTGE